MLNTERQGLRHELMERQTELHCTLFSHAEALRLGGKDTFLLNDPQKVFFVEAGCLDLFLVHLQDGRPRGTRTHVARIPQGQVAFGLAATPSAENVAILAVPGPGTGLRVVSLAAVREYYGRSEGREVVSSWTDTWISTLHAAAAMEPPGEEMVPLGAGAEVVFREEKCAHILDGMTWVRRVDGQSLLYGELECCVGGTSAFPLARNSWLQVSKGTTIVCLDSVNLHQNGLFWDSVNSFHQMVPVLLSRQRERESRSESERLKRKAEIKERLFHDALTHVVEILSSEADAQPDADALSADLLFAACSIVGKSLGITFKQHPDSRSGRAMADPLKGILSASRIRHRSVELKGRWWESDSGALLAFVRESGSPVALIPETTGRYRIVDPELNTSVAVDEVNAKSLITQAVTFYRPFPEKQLNGMDLLRHGMYGCKRDVLAVLGIGTLAAQVAVIVPYLTGYIFDVVIPGSRYSELFQVIFALAISACVTSMFNITRSIATLRIETRMGVSIQAAVWDRVLSLPVPFFRKYSAGNLASRANSIEAIRAVLSGVVVSSILAGMFSVSYFAMLFFYNMKLAMWATVLVGCAVVVATVVNLYQLRYQRLVQEVRVKISGRILQFVSGVAKLRVTGTEGVAFALWSREFTKQRRFQFVAKNLDNIQATFFEVFPIVSTAVMFYQVSTLTESANLSTGSFLAFNAAFTAFVTAALKMTEAVSSLLMTLPLYESAQPILSSVPEVMEAKSDPGKLKGEIELSHIAFRYAPESPLILRDISIRISPGEFVAFVGPSGSGKSTVFRLLLGFETPESGTIYVDGQDLSGLDITAVRQQIGVVLQNGKLLPGDIFNNIVGSSTTLSLDDAWNAARLAGFADDIESMPMGMHTVVSEGGGTLSGGQRQRLMIARAIVKKPNILLMDEATSALDNRTQEIVSRSLDNLKSTRIVIAHRLSTVVHADRICFIEGGFVREQGSYDELMALGGKFAELAKRQLV